MHTRTLPVSCFVGLLWFVRLYEVPLTVCLCEASNECKGLGQCKQCNTEMSIQAGRQSSKAYATEKGDGTNSKLKPLVIVSSVHSRSSLKLGASVVWGPKLVAGLVAAQARELISLI